METTKILLENLKGNVTQKKPVWFMRQAGRHLPEYLELRAKNENFLDFCYHSEYAAEATLQPIRRYNMDGAILFSDILVVPHALGQKTWFEKGFGPKLEPLNLEKLNINKIPSFLSPIFETIKIVKKQLPPHVTFLGFCGCPWTVATYMIQGKGMRDSEAARKYAYKNPKEMEKLLALLVDASVAYLSCQIEAGVDAVQLFDSWSGVLDEQGFKDFCIKPNQKIVSRLKQQYPHIPIIAFPRGAGLRSKDFIDQVDVDAISLDQQVSLSWAKEHLQSKRCIQGNLDNAKLVSGGELLMEATKKILDGWAKGPMVFNLNHGVTPDTPIENVQAVVDYVHAYK